MSALSAPDAVVALRSFPRRWRELLGGLDPHDPDVEALLEHRGSLGSVVTLAAQAAAVLEVAAGHLHQAVTADKPVLAPAPPGPVGGRASDLAALLARIDAAAPALADAVARVPTGDLDREARRGSSTVTVRRLVADVVDEAAGLLRHAARALDEARSPH
jgi:hypothetical protein